MGPPSAREILTRPPRAKWSHDADYPPPTLAWFFWVLRWATPQQQHEKEPPESRRL